MTIDILLILVTFAQNFTEHEIVVVVMGIQNSSGLVNCHASLNNVWKTGTSQWKLAIDKFQWTKEKKYHLKTNNWDPLTGEIYHFIYLSAN